MLYKSKTYIADTLSNLPTPAQTGVLGFTLDTEITYIYKTAGWTAISTSSSAFHSAIVYHSSTQNVTSSTSYTALTCDSEIRDTDGYHSNSTNPSRITIPSDDTNGIYFLSAHVFYPSNATGKRAIVIRHYDSSDVLLQTICGMTEDGQSGGTDVQVSGISRLNATNDEYFQVENFQNSGSTLAVEIQRFTAVRLGAYPGV